MSQTLSEEEKIGKISELLNTIREHQILIQSDLSTQAFVDKISKENVTDLDEKVKNLFYQFKRYYKTILSSYGMEKKDFQKFLESISSNFDPINTKKLNELASGQIFDDKNEILMYFIQTLKNKFENLKQDPKQINKDNSVINLITFSIIPSIFSYFLQDEKNHAYIDFLKDIKENYDKNLFYLIIRNVFVSPLFINYFKKSVNIVIRPFIYSLLHHFESDAESIELDEIMKNILLRFKENLSHFPLILKEILKLGREECITQTFINLLEEHIEFFGIYYPYSSTISPKETEICSYNEFQYTKRVMKEFISSLVNKSNEIFKLWSTDATIECQTHFSSTMDEFIGTSTHSYFFTNEDIKYLFGKDNENKENHIIYYKTSQKFQNRKQQTEFHNPSRDAIRDILKYSNILPIIDAKSSPLNSFKDILIFLLSNSSAEPNRNLINQCQTLKKYYKLETTDDFKNLINLIHSSLHHHVEDDKKISNGYNTKLMLDYIQNNSITVMNDLVTYNLRYYYDHNEESNSQSFQEFVKMKLKLNDIPDNISLLSAHIALEDSKYKQFLDSNTEITQMDNVVTRFINANKSKIISELNKDLPDIDYTKILEIFRKYKELYDLLIYTLNQNTDAIQKMEDLKQFSNNFQSKLIQNNLSSAPEVLNVSYSIIFTEVNHPRLSSTLIYIEDYSHKYQIMDKIGSLMLFSPFLRNIQTALGFSHDFLLKFNIIQPQISLYVYSNSNIETQKVLDFLCLITQMDKKTIMKQANMKQSSFNGKEFIKGQQCLYTIKWITNFQELETEFKSVTKQKQDLSCKLLFKKSNKVDITQIPTNLDEWTEYLKNQFN